MRGRPSNNANVKFSYYHQVVKDRLLAVNDVCRDTLYFDQSYKACGEVSKNNILVSP
jgi:hypothetical protein